MPQAVWFAPLVDSYHQEYIYSEDEKATFRNDTQKLVEHVRFVDGQLNSIWGMFFRDGEAQKSVQEKFRERMAQQIKDERLLEGLCQYFGANKLYNLTLQQVLHQNGRLVVEESHPEIHT